VSAIEPAEVALIVIAKEPLPGRAKTRLCPPLRPAQAAAIAEAALADTLAAVAAVPARRRLLTLEGDPGPWLPAGFEVVAQPSGGLGARLAAAFRAAAGPALLVGMDTPQLTPLTIRAAAAALAEPGVDAVLGPALDGGYWAIGLREPRAAVFAGVPMSCAATASAQRLRLRELGLVCTELDVLRDVDTFKDAWAVAELCVGSRFSAELERVVYARAA
jgi:rSAM/selenodomain-associated transferase 1